jgi:hypothetical protein
VDHDNRREAELIVDLNGFFARAISVDYDETDLSDLEHDPVPSPAAIASWRVAADQYERAKNTRTGRSGAYRGVIAAAQID